MSIQVWIPTTEAIVVLVITCLLMRKYADLKRTSNFSVAMTSLSWFLAFSMIFFIPLDIYIVRILFCLLHYPNHTFLFIQTSAMQ